MATRTHYSTSGLVGANFDGTPTSAEFEVGTRVMGNDGTCWIYVQTATALTQYDAVGIDEDFKASALTKAMADDGWMIGAAQVAFASADYGWVALHGGGNSGAMKVRVASSCAADVALYTTGTAGILDDASTSQTKIDGIVAVAAAGTGTAVAVEAIMTWPKSTTF